MLGVWPRGQTTINTGPSMPQRLIANRWHETNVDNVNIALMLTMSILWFIFFL
jgi:hypothetical protein